MQISNVTSGYSDPAALGKRAEPLEAVAARVSKAEEQRGANSPASTFAAARVLARYDVRSISPVEFSTLVQKLQGTGAITEQEFQELTAIRHDIDAAGMDPERPLDLLEFYSDKVRKLQRQADGDQVPPQMSAVLRRLQWVQKFALIQSQPEAMGINALA